MNTNIAASFEKSIERLSEVLKEPKTAMMRDAAIKRFELTFELAWKTGKEFLGAQGIVCRSPRGCLEELFRLGALADDPQWLTMIEDRNQSVHTYNEELAEKIYGRLPEYLPLFQKLFQAIQSNA